MIISLLLKFLCLLDVLTLVMLIHPPPLVFHLCGYFSVSLLEKVLNKPLMNHSFLLTMTSCPLFASLFASLFFLTSCLLQPFSLSQSSGFSALGCDCN